MAPERHSFGDHPSRRAGDGRAAEPQAHAIGFLADGVVGGVQLAGEALLLRAGRDAQRSAAEGRRRGGAARAAHGALANLQYVAGPQRPPAHTGHDVDRGASHDLGSGNAAAHRQIAARTRAAGAEPDDLAGFDFDRAPQRQTRAEIRPGEGDHCVRFEFERAPGQGHLEGRSVLGVARHEVGGAQRERVGRAGGRDAVMRPAEPAEVLHGGLHSRGNYADAAHSGTKRTRSPMRSSAGGSPAGSNSRMAVRPINRHPPGEDRG